MTVDRAGDVRLTLAKRGTDPKASRTLRRLTKHMINLLLWDEELRGSTWQHGDYIFFVVSMGDETASSFVQVWSEPFDSVVVEASSGRYAPLGPGAAPVRERASILRARGYEIRRGKHNWRRTAPMLDESGCAILAADMLAVMREAFGYDGTTELRLTIGHHTRLVSSEVLRATRPDRLGQLLRSMDIRAEPGDDEGEWRFHTPKGHPARAVLASPVEGGLEKQLHRAMILHAGIEVQGDVDGLAQLLSSNTTFMAVRRQEPNLVVLMREETLAGGVTPDALVLAVRLFGWEVDRLLALLGPPTPPAGR